MTDERKYTIEQIALAARELREAAGADEVKFTAVQVIDMLDDKIRILRERGFTDEQIADLFKGFEIEVTKDQIAEHSPPSL
jgi:hypothetical protein